MTSQEGEYSPVLFCANMWYLWSFFRLCFVQRIPLTWSSAKKKPKHLKCFHDTLPSPTHLMCMFSTKEVTARAEGAKTMH